MGKLRSSNGTVTGFLSHSSCRNARNGFAGKREADDDPTASGGAQTVSAVAHPADVRSCASRIANLLNVWYTVFQQLAE